MQCVLGERWRSDVDIFTTKAAAAAVRSQIVGPPGDMILGGFSDSYEDRRSDGETILARIDHTECWAKCPAYPQVDGDDDDDDDDGFGGGRRAKSYAQACGWGAGLDADKHGAPRQNPYMPSPAAAGFNVPRPFLPTRDGILP